MKAAIKIIALLIIVALTVCGFMNILPISPEETTAPSLESMTYKTDWPGSLKEHLGEDEKALYNIIADAIYESKVTITIPTSTLEIADISKVVESVYYDHPEFFWFNFSGTVFSFDPNYGISVALTYYAAGNELEAMKSDFTAAVNSLTAKTSGITDTWQKVLIIHDTLADNCSYDPSMSEDYIHSSYGAIVNGYAVYDGYAKAFKCALDVLGIPCRIVPGTVLVSNGSENEPHAWNVVQVDSIWTAIDLTWDEINFEFDISEDQIDTYSHAYFGLSTDELSSNHFPDISVVNENIPELLPLNWYSRYSVASEDGSDIIDSLASNLANSIDENGIAYFEAMIGDNAIFISDYYADVLNKANEILSAKSSKLLFNPESTAIYFNLSKTRGTYMYTCIATDLPKNPEN